MIGHIAICDDETEQAEAIRRIVATWEKEHPIGGQIDLFSSAEAFWFAYQENRNYDILLLDVEMRAMSGIELAKRLRASGCHAEIIFITSHYEFVGEGYEVDALHYLGKPISQQKLWEVLSRAADKLAADPPSVVIQCAGETQKLYESDILYVESFLHDIVIHTKTGEYRMKENISAFHEALSDDFFRAHRSYLVNLKAIVRIGRTAVTLGNGSEIPLARGKYDEINRAFIARN